jgi:nucleotide-binding universal stress UspA family protein
MAAASGPAIVGCTMTAPFNVNVVGSDGQHGRAAAALAQTISAATGARLMLLGVETALPLPLVETRAQAHALERELRALRSQLAPDASVRVAIDVSAAHALRRAAEHERSDLIVVGSMQRSRLQRLTSTDRTLQVLHGAPCAVAIAPDHQPYRTELRTVGVGIDGSPESDLALATAIDLVRTTRSSLRLLAVAGEVYPEPTDFRGGIGYDELYRELVDARRREAGEAVEAAFERCRAAGVTASGDVRVGDAATELTSFSSACDLLVLGSRRWGPTRRIALGATAERVIRDAECPVLVTPRGAAAEHGGARHAGRAAVAS